MEIKTYMTRGVVNLLVERWKDPIPICTCIQFCNNGVFYYIGCSLLQHNQIPKSSS